MNTKTSRFGLKAVLSAVLVLTLIFAGLALTVSAADDAKLVSVTSGATTTEYATLAEAVAALADGDTVKLLGDVTVTETVAFEKNVTLDLNGFSFIIESADAAAPVATAVAALTLTDLSEAREGTVYGNIAVGAAGSLTVNYANFRYGLDLGEALVSTAIAADRCVKVSGVPTKIAADATKVEGRVQITDHEYEFVADGDVHNEVCACEYVKPASSAAHSGGTATCIDLAVCEACGAEYGDFVDHVFAYTFNSTQHFEECTVCELEKNHENHYGGTATCSSQAVCENANCGHGYGATPAHTPAGDLVDGTDTYHWQICSVCNQPCNYVAHTYPETWTVITEATHGEEGLRERVCDCGHKITSAIPVLDAGEFPAWAIVLIVILVILVVAVAVFALIWFVVKKKSFADLKALFAKKTEA